MDFLKNKKVLIIIFIFLFVILAAVNFYNIKNNVKDNVNDNIKDNVIEPFEADLDEDQNVGQNKVIIDNTDNVNFNSFGTIKTSTNLTNLLKTASNWNLSWGDYGKNSLASNEGGSIAIGNPNKTADNNKVDNWVIFNMTGGYGDALHFYKYSGGIASSDNAKFVNRGSQLILYDNTWSKFLGPLHVTGDLYTDSNYYIRYGFLKVKDLIIDGSTINSSGGRMHITGTELLYILNTNGVVIGKEWGGNGNLVVQGNLTVNGRINGNLAATTITADNKYSTDTSAWWINNGTGSFVIACSTIPAAQGCIKIETTHWDISNTKATFSTINCNGRLHILSSEMILIMGSSTMIHKSPSLGATGDLIVQGQFSVDGETYLNNRLYVNNEIRANPGAANPNLHLVTKRAMFLMAETVYIYKCTSDCDYWYKPTGNLVVQGIFSANQDAYIGGGLNAPRAYISTGSNEGGHICLINPNKTADNNTVNNWTIFNMTGYYGNGLHFWKYSGEGGTFVNRGTQLALWDNGVSQFMGGLWVNDYLHSVSSLSTASTLHVGGHTYLGSTLYVQGEATFVRGASFNNQNIANINNVGCGAIYASLNTNDRYSIYTPGLLYARLIYGDRIYGNYNWWSDRRLKENIKSITENEKDKVIQLESKSFNMIDDDKKTKRYGFIAQEVEEIYPELVSTDHKGIKTLNYIDLIPLLLEQIKELKKTIPNPNVINIGGVTLNANELQKLKQLINQ